MRYFNVFVLVLLFSIHVGGCDVGTFVDAAPEPFDNDIESIAKSQQYLQSAFVRVNRDPYPTELSESDLIDVYISGEDAQTFWNVDPDSAASAQGLAEEAVIVRVVMDQDLKPSKLTFMIKGPEGYFPEGGDYYYAVTDLDGTIALSDAGEPLAGAIDSCGSCHAQRASSDYLFGVPLSNRGKLPSPAGVHGGFAESSVHNRGVHSPALESGQHHGL